MSDWPHVIQFPWIPVFIGSAILFFVVAVWVWFEHWVDPLRGTIDEPHASAFVRGNCGDAMKISLRFSDDRVVEARYWTDGCGGPSGCFEKLYHETGDWYRIVR